MDGLYYLPNCEGTQDFPPLLFTIGGRDFVVHPKAYILNFEGMCVLLFQTIDIGEDFWIFGLPFMNSVYTYFDMDENKIGFSQLQDEQLKSSGFTPMAFYMLIAICITVIGAYYFNKRKNRDEHKPFLDEPNKVADVVHVRNGTELT